MVTKSFSRSSAVSAMRRRTLLTWRGKAPQIFVNDRHVGGFTELAALEYDNELEAWLPGASNELPADTLPDITER